MSKTLDVRGGNYYINHINPTLSQIEEVRERKMNNLFKLNLLKLKKKVEFYNKIFILTYNDIIIIPK